MIPILQDEVEAHLIVKIVKETSDINGELVEVGACLGGSGELIADNMGSTKMLTVFDTFDGLLDLQDLDSGGMNSHDLKVSFEDFSPKLKNMDNVKVVKGYFPDCVEGTDFCNKTFSFVHLDVDTYVSTKNCLSFFHSKMAKGGAIISHDFGHPSLKGVRLAFDEFYADKGHELLTFDKSTQVLVKY